MNEQTVQDLVVGRLQGEALDDVEHHLAECSSCAGLVAIAGREGSGEAALVDNDRDAAAAARPQPSIATGTMIGHYVVLGFLGAGGMGEVYAAYDPNLERKVAIKFLRPDRLGRGDHEVAAERMRREARLVAKLSHPNVVVVYETGVYDNRLFIAMEHVDGQSVSEWQRAEARSIADILRVFRAAGAGLGAAHAAGVIHRDFKPHNVMLSRTGEVRVMDFGLAHLEASTSEPADGFRTSRNPPAQADLRGDPGDALGRAELVLPRREAGLPDTADDAVEESDDSGGRLTRTGTLLGTPAYMAPEQLRGERASARADQFSFCVALYEALVGRRPVSRLGTLPGAGGTKADAEAAGPARKLPSWLRRILKRGLAEDPKERYPSMEELLVDLAANRTRRRRVILAALAVAVLGTVGVGTALANRNARRVLFCGGYEGRAAAIWPFRALAAGRGTGRVAQAISEAFTRSGVAGAGEIFARVDRTLSTYLKEWSAQATDACEATHVRGEQSREELSLRLACLDERLTAAHALTDALARADAKVVEHAAGAAISLPDLGRCSQLVLLRAAAKPPEGGKKEVVARLRRRMDELKLLALTGHFESVAGDLRALERDIRAANYLPLLADFDILVLNYLWANGGLPESQPDLIREALRAAASSGYEEATAGALIGLVGVSYRNAAVADLAFEQADAVLQHLGDPSELRGWLETNYSMTLYARGRLRDAIAHEQRSLALKRRRTPADGRDLSISESNVCLYLHALGQTAAALPVCERAVQLSVDEVGWGHPHTMNVVENQALVLTDLGRFDEGCPMAERVRAFFHGIGEQTEARTVLMLAFGRCALAEHRTQAAREFLERALSEASAGNATELEMADIERQLARAWLESGDVARAADFTERAARRYEKLPEVAFRAAEIRALLAKHQPG